MLRHIQAAATTGTQRRRPPGGGGGALARAPAPLRVGLPPARTLALLVLSGVVLAATRLHLHRPAAWQQQQPDSPIDGGGQGGGRAADTPPPPPLPRLSARGDILGARRNWHALWLPHELPRQHQGAGAAPGAPQMSVLLLPDAAALAAAAAAAQGGSAAAAPWSAPGGECSAVQRAAASAALDSQLRRRAPAWVALASTVEEADLLVVQVATCGEAAELSRAVLRAAAPGALPPFALWQHGACEPAAAPERWRLALQLWRQAVLVVSPAALELQVQQHAPEGQRGLRLWSAPYGAERLAAGAAADAPPAPLRLLVHGGCPGAGQAPVLQSLLVAAGGGARVALPPHLEPLHSAACAGVSNGSSSPPPAAWGERERRALAAGCAAADVLHGPAAGAAGSSGGGGGCSEAGGSGEHLQQLLERWRPSHLVLLPGPLCDGPAVMAEAAAQGVRLVVVDNSGGSGGPPEQQAHRWLRPFADFVETNSSGGPELAAALAAALRAPSPPPLPEAQAQVQSELLSWDSLVPAVYERLWRQLDSWHLGGAESNGGGARSDSGGGGGGPRDAPEPAPAGDVPAAVAGEQPDGAGAAAGATGYVDGQRAVVALADACIEHPGSFVSWDAEARRLAVWPAPGDAAYVAAAAAAGAAAAGKAGGEGAEAGCSACVPPATASPPWQRGGGRRRLFVSTPSRSAGLCIDAALYALHLGGVVAPECCLAAAAAEAAAAVLPAAGANTSAGDGGSGEAAGARSRGGEDGPPLVWLTLESASPGAVLAWQRLRVAERPEIWFSINPETLNKDNVATNLLLAASSRLLCKTDDCFHRMAAWLRHTRYGLGGGGGSGGVAAAERLRQRRQRRRRRPGPPPPRLLLVRHSTPDPWAAAAPAAEAVAAGAPPAAGADGAVPAGRLDYTRFIHMGGKSGLKHTQELISAWAHSPDLPPLVVATTHEGAAAAHARLANATRAGRGAGAGQAAAAAAPPRRARLPNLRLVARRLGRHEHDALLLGAGIHICTSSKEGFGHYIEQARAAGALVLVTDFPPMREFVGQDEAAGLLCPYESLWPEPTELLGQAASPYQPRVDAHLEPLHVASCVRRALALPEAERATRGAAARAAYLRQQAGFAAAMRRLAAELESDAGGDGGGGGG